MSDAPSMAELCDDLRSEHEWLRTLVEKLDASGLMTPTPAEGWSIADQLTHLAFFDGKAVQAAVDPVAFAAEVARAIDDIEGYEQAYLEMGRSKSAFDLLGWFQGSRDRLINFFSRIDPKERLPWYGPPMSARSSATARFMETWAHGLDVADALGVERPAKDNIRHVCDLGVRTRTFTFVLRGLPEPTAPVRVALTAPSGSTWEWGESESDSVSGPAMDFAMVVTQRRNLRDTSLLVTGPAATEWMTIAQCFAGPPGPGREPRDVAGPGREPRD